MSYYCLTCNKKLKISETKKNLCPCGKIQIKNDIDHQKAF